MQDVLEWFEYLQEGEEEWTQLGVCTGGTVAKSFRVNIHCV